MTYLLIELTLPRILDILINIPQEYTTISDLFLFLVKLSMQDLRTSRKLFISDRKDVFKLRRTAGMDQTIGITPTKLKCMFKFIFQLFFIFILRNYKETILVITEC